MENLKFKSIKELLDYEKNVFHSIKYKFIYINSFFIIISFFIK